MTSISIREEWLRESIREIQLSAVAATRAISVRVDMRTRLPVAVSPLERLFREALIAYSAMQLGICLVVAKPLSRENVRRANRQSLCVARAVRFIDQHYATHLSAHDVAKAAFCSVSTLQRIFRRTLRVTVHEYLADVRYAAFRALMSSSDDKIEAIASEVGYRSRKDLYRECRRRDGMSPGAIRALRVLSQSVSGPLFPPEVHHNRVNEACCERTIPASRCLAQPKH